MESENTQSDNVVGLLAWLEIHKKRLAVGGGLALVVICVTMITIQHQAQKELNASAALSEVRLPFSASAPLAPGTADSLAKVAAEHKGSKAAARALLLSGGVAFSEAKTPGEYAEAQKRFEAVIVDYPDSAWVPQANLGIAAALVAQGKTTEATAKYEEITRRFASSSIIEETRLALARLLEVQKPEEAFKLYEELIKGNPNSVLTMEASMRQDTLLKARPELAKLKEPPVPPISMTPTPNQQVTITQVTNSVTTNVQQVITTTKAAASQPVQIKLNQTPSPGAANPPPAK